jgi:hypothetical protein
MAELGIKYGSQKCTLNSVKNSRYESRIFPTLAVYYQRLDLMPRSDIYFVKQNNCRKDSRARE